MTENPSWGSDRIVGALANLHFRISDSTLDNIRKRDGLPADILLEHNVLLARTGGA